MVKHHSAHSLWVVSCNILIKWELDLLSNRCSQLMGSRYSMSGGRNPVPQIYPDKLCPELRLRKTSRNTDRIYAYFSTLGWCSLNSVSLTPSSCQHLPLTHMSKWRNGFACPPNSAAVRIGTPHPTWIKFWNQIELMKSLQWTTLQEKKDEIKTEMAGPRRQKSHQKPCSRTSFVDKATKGKDHSQNILLPVHRALPGQATPSSVDIAGMGPDDLNLCAFLPFNASQSPPTLPTNFSTVEAARFRPQILSLRQ